MKDGNGDGIPSCPVEVTLEMMGNRWKVLILRELFRDGVRRFSELYRNINGITHKMLTQQLRHLERDGIITRKAYAEVPPKVEYSLTPVGESLRPVIASFHEWGNGFLNGRAGLEEAHSEEG
jgi:DNA-binding HxlR family transcriptional regulator